MATDEHQAWDTDADDDWFGDGTAFKTEEELAAALFSLAGTLGLDGAPHPVEPSPFPLDDTDLVVVAPAPHNGNGNGTRRHRAAPRKPAEQRQVAGAQAADPPDPGTSGTAQPDGSVDASPLHAVTTDDGSVFELIDAFEPAKDTAVRAPRPAVVAPPTPRPVTWSLRAPGAEVLPPRQPGRTGWSIRNSVKLLQQIEDTMDRLREEAVVAAFNAAARALQEPGAAYSGEPAATGARSASRRRISM